MVAALLAREKARAVSAKHPDRMVLGADQTLALGQRRFSKAPNRAVAREQLAALRGNTHTLHSAVAVMRGGAVAVRARRCRASDDAELLRRLSRRAISTRWATRRCRASAAISSKAPASSCSSASRAIISRCWACRCSPLLDWLRRAGHCWRSRTMFVIGLTGSIAMGKTTTARLFAEEGVPVHDADAAVHKLYEGEAVAPIEAAFPGVTKDGKVDRGALGQRVAGDPAALRRLEQIVHPLVRGAETGFLREAEAAGRQGRRARHSAAVRDRRRQARRCGRGGVGAGGNAARAGAGARRSAWNGWRRCWRGRCPMPRSAGGRISWWIARRESSTRARRCGKSLPRLLRCRPRRK